MTYRTAEDLLALYDHAPLNRRCWVSFALLGVETRGRPIALGEEGRSPMRPGTVKTAAS
ncbi:MAG: hypothetical protein WA633_13200 [Stellaceae bacterium]